jgi:hypothetical protein
LNRALHDLVECVVLEMAMERRASRKGCDRRRDRRYQIRELMSFRTSGGEWRDATTVNVGSRGALISTSPPVPPPGTSVQLRIPLPPSNGMPGACIASRGRIVRISEAPAGRELWVAVAITTSRLRRPQRQTSREPLAPPPAMDSLSLDNTNEHAEKPDSALARRDK